MSEVKLREVTVSSVETYVREVNVGGLTGATEELWSCDGGMEVVLW